MKLICLVAILSIALAADMITVATATYDATTKKCAGSFKFDSTTTAATAVSQVIAGQMVAAAGTTIANLDEGIGCSVAALGTGTDWKLDQTPICKFVKYDGTNFVDSTVNTATITVTVATTPAATTSLSQLTIDFGTAWAAWMATAVVATKGLLFMIAPTATTSTYKTKGAVTLTASAAAFDGSACKAALVGAFSIGSELDTTTLLAGAGAAIAAVSFF